jgi:teichuronic acid biosynthesis glycosyltransferase TuaG
MRFAIIIPVYNGQAFIARAIESCLGQAALPDEIIVIDDASTDDTASIVRSFNSSLIRYERNEKNSGPSFSRNRGMQLATADWILFLDADDIFHTEKIRIIRECIQSDETIKSIGHAFDLMGEKKIIPAEIPSLKKLTSREILLRNAVVTPALCVSAQNRILFNEQMSYAEDHDFILRTTEKFGLWFLDLPLCSLQRMPLTEGGISSNKWKMRKGEMKMYIDYCKRNNWYPAVPFLLLFSLLKHARQMLAPKSSAVH